MRGDMCEEPACVQWRGSGVMAAASLEGRAAMKLLVLTAFYALVFGGVLLLRRMARADLEEWHGWAHEKEQTCATSISDC
jgi:hypothetical protein